MQSRMRLPYALLIVTSISFITVLIVLTHDLEGLWPLFGIPILLAAVAYHASGAVLISAAAFAIVGLLVSDMGATTDPGLFSRIALGIGVFAVSAVLIGMKIGRDERRCDCLERSSIRDELTGLHTRDYFLFRLEEDVRRCRRYETGLSVLLVELDGLEEFSATVGTHRGNLFVSHAAEVLSMSVRETDVIAHLEDGLFGIILPFADGEEALIVGERIREVIEATDFEGDELEPITHHTVSVGVAEHEQPTMEGLDLLEQASEGLRRARMGGGNRVLLGVRDVSQAKEATDGPSRPTTEALS